MKRWIFKYCLNRNIYGCLNKKYLDGFKLKRFFNCGVCILCIKNKLAYLKN